MVLQKHPQAKGGAELLCGPGQSYQVFMATSMEPPVKLLVPGMNKWLQSAVIKLLGNLLSTSCLPDWTFSCQEKERTEGGEGRGQWWRSGCRRWSGEGQETQQSSEQFILLGNCVILF